MNSRICPETGAPMHRDVRPLTLTYKGESLTFNMPGWYCDFSDESIRWFVLVKKNSIDVLRRYQPFGRLLHP